MNEVQYAQPYPVKATPEAMQFCRDHRSDPYRIKCFWFEDGSQLQGWTPSKTYEWPYAIHDESAALACAKMLFEGEDHPCFVHVTREGASDPAFILRWGDGHLDWFMGRGEPTMIQVELLNLQGRLDRKSA